MNSKLISYLFAILCLLATIQCSANLGQNSKRPMNRLRASDPKQQELEDANIKHMMVVKEYLDRIGKKFTPSNVKEYQAAAAAENAAKEEKERESAAAASNRRSSVNRRTRRTVTAV